jgi:hypothetical protein
MTDDRAHQRIEFWMAKGELIVRDAGILLPR